MVDSAEEQKVSGMVPTGIGGATFAVEDPSTGKVLAEVADASPAHGLRALDAMRRRSRPGPPREQRDPVPRLRAAARAAGGVSPADDPGDGQAAG
jgi:succinate-semialdehyde dehydrogenase/glutarate-semialdehyde dehydrogenase